MVRNIPTVRPCNVFSIRLAVMAAFVLGFVLGIAVQARPAAAVPELRVAESNG